MRNTVRKWIWEEYEANFNIWCWMFRDSSIGNQYYPREYFEIMFGTEAENPDAFGQPPLPAAEERYPYVETRPDDEIRHPLPYFAMGHYKMAVKVTLTCARMRLERCMYPLAALGIVMDGKARPEIEEYINRKEEEEKAEKHEKEYEEEHEKWRNTRELYTTWTRRSVLSSIQLQTPTTTVIDPQKRYPLTPPLLHDRRT